MLPTALWQHDMQWAQWAVVVGGSLIAAYTDLRSRRIPNWLTGPMFLGGLVWSIWLAGGAGVLDALAGCVALAIPCTLLFMFAGGGAGDAKLMGAAGAWLGLANSLAALVAVSACGIVMGLALAVLRKQTRQTLANTVTLASQAMFAAKDAKLGPAVAVTQPSSPKPKQTMPYGVAIFAGLCIGAAGMMSWHA